MEESTPEVKLAELKYLSLVGAEIAALSARLAMFIEKHNRIPGGNAGYIPASQIEGWANLQSVMVLALLPRAEPDFEATFAEGKLIGLVLAMIVPVISGDDTPTKPALAKEPCFDGKDRQADGKRLRNLLKNGRALPMSYTTYNCVHTDFRKRGLGHDIIVKLKEAGLPLGIQYGYHIMPGKMYESPIKVQQWMRPINPSRARKLGFKIPDMAKILSISRSTKTKDRSNRRGLLKLKSCLSPVTYTLITDEEIKSSYEEYLVFSEGPKLVFRPSVKYWRRYIKAFETYRVLSKEEVVGIFSVLPMTMILNSTGKSLESLNMVLAVGNTKDVVSAAIKLCSETKALVLYLNEVGCLDGKTLDSMYCLKTDHIYSLLTYNLHTNIKKTDVCLPLF